MIGDLFDSPWKILIVAVLLIVLFGSKKLPDAARSLGRSMRILKAEVTNLHADDEEPQAASQAQPLPVSQQIEQLQQQVRDLQQQPASETVTVNGASAPQAPRTQQPG